MILESLTIPVGFDTGLLLEGFSLIKGGFEQVGSFLKASTEEAMEAQEVQAQLEAVLKSTGGAAGVTAEMANELASKYQGLTRFSDDAVLSAENMLLTFTSIGKEVFPDALETVLNMSQALGQDLKSSSIQLGKALNDPISGITALRRVGVQFTDSQEEMIKNLVESGDLMGAQKLILQELQTEFGGSAVAAGQTFGGQLDILKNKISDIKERIGGALLPTLQEMTNKLGSIVDTPAFQSMIDFVVVKLQEGIGWVGGLVDAFVTGFGQDGDIEQAIINVLEYAGLDWLAEQVPLVRTHVEEMLTDLGELSAFLKGDMPISIGGVQVSWEGLARTWRRSTPVVEQLNRLSRNLNNILEKLDPSTGKVAGKFTALGVAQRLAVAVATIVNGVLLGLERTLDGLNDNLEWVIDNWNELADAARYAAAVMASIVLPWWMTPGSPTPLENGLRGITDAMVEMNNTPVLPKLISQGSTSQAPFAQSSGMDEARLARLIGQEMARQLG